MATKRVNGASKAQVAKNPMKKTRTEVPEAQEAPLLALIASIDNIPKPCRDLLQGALPHCLGVAEIDRHHFQMQVLDSVKGIMADIENKKRDAIADAQAELASLEVEKDSVTSGLERQSAASASKKAECDEKSKGVDISLEMVASAKQALTAVQKEQEEFTGKKDSLVAEQGNFSKLMTEVFQPLKEGSITKWQTRNKLIAELQKVEDSVGLEASLCDALVATLKLKAELREGFAKKTLQCVDSSFAKHTEKLAHDIAGLDAEVANHQDAVAAAEAAIVEKSSDLQTVEKEWDDLQNEWVALENACAQGSRKLTSLDLKVVEAAKQVDNSQKELSEFLKLPALLEKLKEPHKAVELDAIPEESTPSKAPVVSGSSYYETVDGMQCDRGIIDACRTAVAGCGDGRVSVDDARKVFVKIADGAGKTAIERWTLRYCMQEFKWTEAAHDWIVEELKKVRQEGVEADEPAAKKPRGESGCYYEVIDGCKCDRGIVEACREAMGGQGDGRVSTDDAERVWAKAIDAGKVTDAEKWTLRYCLSTFTWTRPAQDWLRERLHAHASQEA